MLIVLVVRGFVAAARSVYIASGSNSDRLRNCPACGWMCQRSGREGLSLITGRLADAVDQVGQEGSHRATVTADGRQ